MTTLEGDSSAALALAEETSKPAAGLKPSMKVIGALLITLSSVTPASSVFVLAPGVLSVSGSGAFLSMALASFVCIFIALVYAELSSAFPLSGGEYAVVGRVGAPFAGFVVLGLVLVNLTMLVGAVASGMSVYLGALFPGLPAVPTALVTVTVTTLISILNIRANAAITGLFLVVELAALVLLACLGFVHVSRPVSDLLLHPAMLQGGHMIHAPFIAIGLGASAAMLVLQGFGTAIYLGEETHDATRHVARAILWALGITVFAETIPITAVLMGAPGLKAFLGSNQMFSDFALGRGGQIICTILDLSIALSIFNALIAMIVQSARVLYSTGRDAVWHPLIDRALTRIHPKFDSPWAATLIFGALALLTCFIPFTLLTIITGTGIVFICIALCLTTIAGRLNGKTGHGAYKMPFFPAAPLIALAGLLYVIYASFLDRDVGRPSLVVSLGVIAVAGAYYLLVLRRRGAWTLVGPED